MSEANKEIHLKQNKKECDQASQEAFNRILAAYRLVVDEISDDCFEDVNKVMKKEMCKSFEKAGSAFKERLFLTIKESFTKIWHDREMDLNVSVIEMCKQHLTTNKNWRPYDKTAEEQLKPHVIKMRLKERDLLRREIEVQKEKIRHVINILEERRAVLCQKMQHRAEVMAEIDRDLLKVEENSTKVDKALHHLHSINRV